MGKQALFALMLGFGTLLVSACGEDEGTFDCGPEGLRCKDGELCVTFAAQLVAYECVANPCAGAPDCECAASICQDPFGTCATDGARNLGCTCIAC